jgi:hypothetical protein
MPKQHPRGFGWQPKAATKLTDSIPRTLEFTLIKTFVGTMDEAINMIEEDEDWIMGEIWDSYSITEPKIDGWSTTLINKELNKYGN